MSNTPIPPARPATAATLVAPVNADFVMETDAPLDYDPADYRWVPVRRRPRFDGWTEEKQRRFIEVLADTGIVTAAATAVGMSRESANRLRRSPRGAAFARAWDAARLHAGSALEDIAFERAIDGVEHNVFDEHGTVICTKRVYNDRLLTFLLRHLKPERYGRHADHASSPPSPPSPASPAPTPPPPASHPALPPAAPEPASTHTAPAPIAAIDAMAAAEPLVALEASLRAMEPPLPAPPQTMLGAQTLRDELALAEAADGDLPHFLREQRPAPSPARIKADAWAAQLKRGAAAMTAPLNEQSLRDMCIYLDPAQRDQRGKKRFR